MNERIADGGWSYVKRLFFPREVLRLRVPGRFRGQQFIEVQLDDGTSVSVAAPTIDQAWDRLTEAARVMTPAPKDPPHGK